MINKNNLLVCKTEEPTRAELYDISCLKPDGNIYERLSGFIKTAKNPYCFRVKDTPVKLVFSDKASAPDIETALVNIATRRMG